MLERSAGYFVPHNVTAVELNWVEDELVKPTTLSGTRNCESEAFLWTKIQATA